MGFVRLASFFFHVAWALALRSPVGRMPWFIEPPEPIPCLCVDQSCETDLCDLRAFQLGLDQLVATFKMLRSRMDSLLQQLINCSLSRDIIQRSPCILHLLTVHFVSRRFLDDCWALRVSWWLWSHSLLLVQQNVYSCVYTRNRFVQRFFYRAMPS